MASSNEPNEPIEIVDDNKPNLAVEEEEEEDEIKTGRKNKSWVWDHFTRLMVVEGKKPTASCNHCSQVFSCDSNANGTTTMGNHVKLRCRKYDYSEYNLSRSKEKKQKTLGFEPVSKRGGLPKLTAVNFSQDACRMALAKMVILDEWSFRAIEGEWFKQLLFVFFPKFNPPGRVTIAKDCMKIYLEEKKKLKKALKEQWVCFTTDTWTSIQNINYMVLTAHFIDCDWKLHKKIINFCLVPNHKGETLGRSVEQCLVEWGISNILTVTIDNASSNNGIIDYLKKRRSDAPSTILDHQFLHVRCSAHILNFIVCEGLKEVDESIARVRNVVRYVRSSPQRYAKFRECVASDENKCKLVPQLDVQTRWNSTYFMLERAIIYQKSFVRLEDEDGKEALGGGVEVGIDHVNVAKNKRKCVFGTPNSHDWDVVQMCVGILKVFYLVTERFSGSLYVTCNTFFKEIMTIKSSIVKMENSMDPKIMLLASNMNMKFEKYWGGFEKINPMLMYANVLDPRYKFVYLKWVLAKYYDNDKIQVQIKVDEMKIDMTRIYNWYERRSIVLGEAYVVSEWSKNKDKNKKRSLDESEEMDEGFLQHLEEECNMVSKSELERYWLETNEGMTSGDKFDVLAWWKANSSRYPILSQMARDILAIPVSTVASESPFSTGGRVIDPYRTSLSPKVAEALICAQNWLRSPTQISLREVMDEVEALEAEILEALEQESCVTHE